MREHYLVRDSIGFILAGNRHVGTVFIVKVLSSKVAGLDHFYLVTAKHCIDQVPGDRFKVRFNVFENEDLEALLKTLHKKRQKFDSVDHDGDPLIKPFELTVDTNWYFHPDGVADVAVKPFEFPDGIVEEGIDIRGIAFNRNDFNAGRVVVGDEGFILGLFTRHPGHHLIVPLYRSFNVAAMGMNGVPLKINVEGFDDHESYLIEVRSIGGMSGAPAFVKNSPDFKFGDKRDSQILLLGLVHGHWDIRADRIKTVADPGPDAKRGDDAINSGIAVVTPAKRILEALDRPELVAMRKKKEKATADDERPTPDVAREEVEDHVTMTSEESILRAANRPPMKKMAKRKKD